MTDFRTFRTSDGLRLHYAVDDFTDPWRPAETLVLLHAAMGNVERFRGWVPTLARDFRVVRLDTRGHGRSETPGPDAPVTIERLTRDVVELLLHEVRAPTLIVVPGADAVGTREGYELLRRIPHHEYVVYEGLAHNITNGAPERCAADLRRFLPGQGRS